MRQLVDWISHGQEMERETERNARAGPPSSNESARSFQEPSSIPRGHDSFKNKSRRATLQLKVIKTVRDPNFLSMESRKRRVGGLSPLV